MAGQSSDTPKGPRVSTLRKEFHRRNALVVTTLTPEQEAILELSAMVLTMAGKLEVLEQVVRVLVEENRKMRQK